MSAALLDELLDFFAAPIPAKAANPANREHPCGLAADSGPCEGPRKPANPGQACPAATADSQVFAAVRTPCNTPGSEERRGISQNSHVSQGAPTTCTVNDLNLAAVAWTDADIARFLDRRARLLRWGWTEADADRLADRLVRRDREGGDDRVSCAGECGHYLPGRCSNHQRAGLQAPDVGRDLAGLLQRCPGFKP